MTAKNSVTTFPKNERTKILITQAVDSLNAVYDSLHIIRSEMLRLSSLLLEFDVVTVRTIWGSSLIVTLLFSFQLLNLSKEKLKQIIEE